MQLLPNPLLPAAQGGTEEEEREPAVAELLGAQFSLTSTAREGKGGDGVGVSAHVRRIDKVCRKLIESITLKFASVCFSCFISFA